VHPFGLISPKFFAKQKVVGVQRLSYFVAILNVINLVAIWQIFGYFGTFLQVAIFSRPKWLFFLKI
jgi:hypothetical protein